MKITLPHNFTLEPYKSGFKLTQYIEPHINKKTGKMTKGGTEDIYPSTLLSSMERYANATGDREWEGDFKEYVKCITNLVKICSKALGVKID